MWIAVAMSGAFLARHPLKLAIQDRLRGRRYPRTAACERLALAYVAVTIGALAAVRVPGALLVLALSVPFAAAQLWSDARGDGRSAAAEILGGIAAAPSAAAIAIAAGAPAVLALALSVLVLARAIPSVLFVRALLRGRGRWIAMATHVLAVLASMALVVTGIASWPVIAATAILLIRAVIGSSGGVRPPAKVVGFREVGYGIVTVALFVAGTI
jgi:hypothetical protein